MYGGKLKHLKMNWDYPMEHEVLERVRNSSGAASTEGEAIHR